MTPKSVLRDEKRIQLALNQKYLLGKRVQISPHYDLWMRGARYGQVHRVYYRGDLTMVAIKMDHPQVRKLARMPVADITLL